MRGARGQKEWTYSFQTPKLARFYSPIPLASIVIPNPVAPLANGSEGSAFSSSTPRIKCGPAAFRAASSVLPYRARLLRRAVFVDSGA